MIHAFLITLGVLAAIYFFPLILAILRSGWFWKLVAIFILANIAFFVWSYFDWKQERETAHRLEAQYELTHPEIR